MFSKKEGNIINKPAICIRYKHVILYLLVPFILELIIESLNRKSIFKGIEYMFNSPLLFCFNLLIILLTLSVALFFKREIFVFVSVSTVWLLFGIANYIILHFRVTPFSAVDFTLIKSAISVSGHYFSALNIAMMIVAVCLITFCMICLYRKAPYHKHRNNKRIIFSVVSVISIAFVIFFIKSSSSSVQALSTNYTNISEAYENYGFVYCFTNSILDTGIKKPQDYSEESVKGITDKLDTTADNADNLHESVVDSNKETPNIIFIQLESFFDVDYVKGLECSEDAIPVFHSLAEKYSSGLLTVPTVGAGTVNTEFEVLTGLRQHDFGVCEYPYKTILKSTTSESICNDLKALGYESHSVHNNEATFYGRNKVFKNLGFDTFTSMEYMNGITENDNGWANDDILVDEIIKTLDSTKGSDFTFGITVQSHGKYDVEPLKTYPISVSGAPEGMESSYTYYVNQIAQVDDMIGNLIDCLDKRDEKTILVLYGDHLPSLELKSDQLVNGDLYQTQYVTWNNFGLEKKDKNITSYQLYPYILDMINIHEGIVTKFHQQTDWNSLSYEQNLTTLAYDILYGNHYAYGGFNVFEPSDLKMGIDIIKIDDIQKSGDGYIATGTGFTPYSEIYFDNDKLETEWIDDKHIKIIDEIEYSSEEEEPEEEEVSDKMPDGISETDILEEDDAPNSFVVHMVNPDGILLSKSEALLYTQTSLYH